MTISYDEPILYEADELYNGSAPVPPVPPAPATSTPPIGWTSPKRKWDIIGRPRLITKDDDVDYLNLLLKQRDREDDDIVVIVAALMELMP